MPTAVLMTPSQYTTLVTLVALRLPAAVDAGYVSNITGPDVAAKMPTSTRTDTVARWLVDEILRASTPAYFISVVEFANDLQSGAASLVTLANTLRTDPAQWQPLDGARPDWTVDSDPLAVADGRPFVDRRGFRELLPRFGVTGTPACILVTGDTAGGKSYLHDFCRALVAGREGLSIGYARVPSNDLANPSPRPLAERLALDLDVSIDAEPDEHGEPERDAENLATWIARYSVDRSIPALAILDEFGRSGVSPAHHKFVVTLARRVQDDARVRARLRVVLIDYQKERLSDAGIQYQHYVLEPIEASHLEMWFRMRFPGHENYRYETAAQRIADRVTKLAPAQRMEGLNNFVRAAALKFA
ncbi:ATP-binding protein [Variovorax sp. YR752]|uniref:ATP-binding protein n=1 Tax=Variovorax sp. YR752 TaxID=1884383 RepID=UPI0031378DA8